MSIENPGQAGLESPDAEPPSPAPMSRPRRRVRAMLLGAAIGVGCVLAAAPAGADPHPAGNGPNPFGGLSCGCPDKASGGSAETQAITRGIREGLSPLAPAPAPASKLLP